MSDSSDPPPLPRPAPADHNPGLPDRAREFISGLRDVAPDMSWAAVTFVVVVVAGVLAWSRLGGPPDPPLETALPTLTPVAPAHVVPASTPGSVEVVVHVAGAVVRPGVYQLPGSSRIADAIDAAGGATDDADLDRVNLAAVLSDAQQVFVPVPGESPPVTSSATDPSGAVGSPTTVVDVNTATADELESLPGVGPVTAAAIVAHRTEHGPFASVSALDEVTGIGPAKLEQLREFVTTGPGA